MPDFPLRLDTVFDIVPVDLVANAVVALLPQVPAMQTSGVSQVELQPPQCSMSLARLTHVPPHSVRPAWQVKPGVLGSYATQSFAESVSSTSTFRCIEKSANEAAGYEMFGVNQYRPDGAPMFELPKRTKSTGTVSCSTVMAELMVKEFVGAGDGG